MFTAQHYKSVAKLIKDQRQRISDKYPDGRPSEAYMSEQSALSDVEAAFIRTFKSDNPKFEELLFIGACGYVSGGEVDDGEMRGVFRKYT